MSNPCPLCRASFSCAAEDLNFYARIGPTASSGSRHAVCPPTLCPACRRQRRLAFINERNLYRRSCSLSGKSIISVYSPNKPYAVYEPAAWWSDRWDGRDFGRQAEVQRPLFEQLSELDAAVPKQSLTLISCENCDFNSRLTNSKNCYLCFGSADLQDCAYCSASINLKDCLEVWWSNKVELSYEIFSADRLYHCFYCDDCADCSDLYFCKSCRDCTHCFGCANLVHRQYHVFNRSYSKSEYQNFMAGFNSGSWREVERRRSAAAQFFLSLPHPPGNLRNAENCSGDMLYFSKNAKHCFTVAGAQDCKYLYQCARVQDAFDMDHAYDCSGLTYECLDSALVFDSAFLINCHNCSGSFYLLDCCNTRNCFACTGLRNAEYCLLNKQYAREDYLQLVDQLVQHMQATREWGEFFPLNLSPFGYNETLAQYYYPLSKQGAAKLDAAWCDYQPPETTAAKTRPAADLPDDVADAPADITQSAIACASSGRPFRITSAELDFYRRLKIPLPRRHPDERFAAMLNRAPAPVLWERQCQCRHDGHGHTGACRRHFSSSIAPTRAEIVYCEECFNRELR